MQPCGTGHAYCDESSGDRFRSTDCDATQPIHCRRVRNATSVGWKWSLRDSAMDYGCYPGAVQWAARIVAGQSGDLHANRHSIVDPNDADASAGNVKAIIDFRFKISDLRF